MKTHSSTSKKHKILSLLLFLVSLALSIVMCILFVKQTTPQHLLARLGLIEEKTTNYTLLSWERSLEQLDFDADIVFIGDSLTIGEDFQSYFYEKKILNLGLSGDTIDGIYKRCSIISKFKPEKIFIEGGVNSMRSNSVSYIVDRYSDILSLLCSENPDSEIYIQSVLPISSKNEKGGLTNANIKTINDELKNLAKSNNVTYIDIHSTYLLGTEMNPEYTKDGIHLKDEYKDLWINILRDFI